MMGMKSGVGLASVMAATALFAQGNLLKNGDFEQGTLPGADGWGKCPHYRVEAHAGRNGSRGLIVENHDPNAMSGEFYGQFVNVKPGFKYRFSGWVKCANVTGKAKDTGIAARVLVLVFVYDAKGKGLGEYYTEFKAGTVADWTKIEGTTPVLPATAARIQVNPFVWHNATGCAWFDDISIEQVETVPLKRVFSSAYRDTAWESSVRFSALLGIDEAATPLDTLTAEFVWSNGAFGSRRAVATAFTSLLAAADVPVDRLPLGTYPVSFELRRKADRSLVAEASVLFTRTKEAPKRKVWIDGANRLIVEGKPFFPLGFYSKTIDEKYLARMDGGPFNCLMPYKYLGTKEFDVAARHGLWIIANMKDFVPRKGGTPCNKVLESHGEADRGLISRFYQLKDYPKLLCWYLNDESSVAEYDRLARQYRFVRENDPDHPTWSVLFQHDQIREYLGSFDIVGNDNYPIGQRPIETVATTARNTFEGSLRAPCWHVPQAISWKSYITTGDTSRFRVPTLEEARSMSWQFIANGGNGLVYYTLDRLIDEGEEHWRNYCTVADEVRSLVPVLLSDPAPGATGWPELVCGRAWQRDGKTYQLVVNENAEARKAELKLPKRFASARAARALPATARFVLDGDRLTVDLEPLGVVMLELQ